ncbi:MAG: putative metallopeptidase [archaeon]|nr:putative metallopeptidase [archaeon]
MKYAFAQEENEKVKEIIQTLEFRHIPENGVIVFKSQGSKTRRTIARIHGLPKLMQLGLQREAFYVIELISEKYYNQPEEEKLKTLIHELMHIPHNFGGGFRQHHPYVTHKQVDAVFQKYVSLKK